MAHREREGHGAGPYKRQYLRRNFGSCQVTECPIYSMQQHTANAQIRSPVVLCKERRGTITAVLRISFIQRQQKSMHDAQLYYPA
jgi:hypothetical protein